MIEPLYVETDKDDSEFIAIMTCVDGIAEKLNEVIAEVNRLTKMFTTTVNLDQFTISPENHEKREVDA